MDRCCFTTVVYGWYQDFIPIYIYSILKSFPQHYVKIFLLDSLRYNNKRALKYLRDDLSDQFEIVENFSDLDWCQIPHKAAIRFLLTKDYFEGFDYVYFGDVDFLIYNQFDDNFYDTYVTHCGRTGLPFSNGWNYYDNRHRVTGLHFVVKEPYFRSMTDIIEETKIPREKYSDRCFRSQCIFNEKAVSYDEEMLFYMLTSVFDINKIKNYERIHHGVHFGLYRYLYEENASFKHRSKALLDFSFQTIDEIPDLEKIRSLCNSELYKKLSLQLGEKANRVIDTSLSIFKRRLFL